MQQHTKIAKHVRFSAVEGATIASPSISHATGINGFRMMIVISLLYSHVFFAYYSVAATANFIVQEESISIEQLGVLFAAFIVGYTVMTPFAPSVLHVLGIKMGSLLCNFTILAGNLVYTLGLRHTNGFMAIGLMFVGRFLFGMGAKGLDKTQESMLSRWFDENNLGNAFAFSETFVQVFGSALAFFILPPTASMIDFHQSLYFIIGFCALSLLANVAYVIYDDRYNRQLFVDDEAIRPRPKWRDMGKLPLEFWIASLSTAAMLQIFFILTGYGPLFVEFEWNWSSEAANRIIALLFVVRLLRPVSSWILSNYGLRGLIQILGIAGVATCLFIFDYSPNTPPYVGFLFLAFFYLFLESNGYAIIEIFVGQELLLLANSVLYYMINIGSALAIYFYGYLLRIYSHRELCLPLAVYAALACALFFILLVRDCKGKKLLWMSQKELDLRETDDKPLLQTHSDSLDLGEMAK